MKYNLTVNFTEIIGTKNAKIQNLSSVVQVEIVSGDDENGILLIPGQIESFTTETKLKARMVRGTGTIAVFPTSSATYLG